jgi:hypothetical protein
VAAIAVGEGQTCVLVDGGQARCLGANGEGELGIGDTSEAQKTPQVVVDGEGHPLSGLEAIVAFERTTCARRPDRRWSCWGMDPRGILGLGRRGVPADVPFLAGARSMTLAAGERIARYYEPGKTIDPTDAIQYAYVCGVFDDGVRCRTARQNHVDAVSFGEITLHQGPAEAVASGKGAVCVLAAGGELQCNRLDVSRSGPGSTPTATCEDGICEEDADDSRERVFDLGAPDALTMLGPVDGASASAIDVGDQHACFVTSDRSVECLGLSTSGEAGVDGVFIPNGESRVGRTHVAGVADVAELALGNAYACARTTQGEVRCWGNNTAGQLGQEAGAPFTNASALRVPLSAAASALAAGRQHACAAVGPERQLVCWGSAYTAPGG